MQDWHDELDLTEPIIVSGESSDPDETANEDETAELDETTRLDVELELDRRINFAMQQNDVPVVKALRLVNHGDMPVRNITVELTSDPGFARPWSTRIAEVGPGATYNIPPVDLELSHAFLAGLTERVRGELDVHVRLDKGHDVKPIVSRTETVELLTRDEWGGLASLPEIIAAFVQPNHPVVGGVLRDAATLLKTWTGNSSLDGYQSGNPERVLWATAAVYGAIQQLSLTYINPPASFEERGQRVRSPGAILTNRMATCLDIALFAAACLEQAGLHPLVVVIQGHAFTGVWLQEECFPDSVVDDRLRIRKRVDLKEIAVFDPTAATSSPSHSFESAKATGERWLDDPQRFHCAIDVARARKGRIRPLPEKLDAPDEASDIEGADGHEPRIQRPEFDTFVGVVSSEDHESVSGQASATRLDRWGRKLLDLSLRNRLLNFRDTRKSLSLLCPDLSVLEDRLAAGDTFQILEPPTELRGADPRDPAAYQRRTGMDGIAEMLRKGLDFRRIYTSVSGQELEQRLVEIYRAARLGLEEGGASGLYLALGFLTWYESENSELPRHAPIILIPLELTRQSARQGFSLRQSDEEPRINVTLLELLKQDHGVTIPGLDPLPEDESGLDIPRILRTVRQAVRDIDRWDVVDQASIGLFSFAKFLMWRDLIERTEELLRNPVVDHLVNRPLEPFDTGGLSVTEVDGMDDTFSPTETFCPLPADSSQLAAVHTAAKGLSFVLEGPPGTGKSQTITNLIAHCLAEGKTVLFVSEKMAALNVVHSRLSAVGLAPYCLELHSNKAQKSGVLGQFEQALALHGDAEAGEDWEREASRLAELRRRLNAYTQALHRRGTSGYTPFRALSRLIGLKNNNTPRVPLRWDSVDALNAKDLEELRDLVARLRTTATACGDIVSHPWGSIRRGDWSPEPSLPT